MIRKFFQTIVCISLICAVQSLWAQAKIDPFLSLQPLSYGLKAQATFPVSGRKNDNRPVEVLIKSNDVSETLALIKRFGGMTHTVAGDIITATIEAPSIAGLANNLSVSFIEGSKPVMTKNNVAQTEINSTEVHSGNGLSHAYTGKGVIVGVIDTGIDYNHPDFLDAEGRNRILYIWDQNNEKGTAPLEISNSYGTECKTDSIISGDCPLEDTDGHGTHVAGTMAGRHEIYGGMAPDANIVVVSYNSSLDLSNGYADTIFSSKICQAAYYVFAKADSLGMPAVVNLSLGTHLGAHDGTSLFEQCLAALVTGTSGKAIVAAAGNEYSSDENYTGIHAGYDVNSPSATNFVIRQVSKDLTYYIDLWGKPGSDLSVGLALRMGAAAGEPTEYSGQTKRGETKEGFFADKTIKYVISATEISNVLNGKPHVGVKITLDSSVTDPSKFSFDLVVDGSGSFDAWLFPDKPQKTIQFTSVNGDRNAPWRYIAGDRIKSVSIPATSPDIIAVGAYTTRNQWDRNGTCCKVSFELGEILDFSSSGPSLIADAAVVKPDIAAPGAMIASALSTSTKANNLLLIDEGMHALQAGTSMAAPFVSGTIALMFSADPNFTHEDVMRYLAMGAYTDDFTDTVPNDRWGMGKLDTLTTLDLAIKNGASGHFSGNEATNAPEIPTESGSGGCSFSKQDSDNSVGYVPILIFVFAVFPLLLKRRQVI